MNLILEQGKKIKSKLLCYLYKIGSSPLQVTKAEQIFYISYLQEGMTVFDVGSNIGELSLLFSQFVGSSGKVFAFEPCSTTFKKLSTICQTADRRQIYLNQFAVADKEGTLYLNIYDDIHSQLNSLADRPLHEYGLNIKSVSQEAVQVVTLDHFCEQNYINYIDLLKIDVEGAEYQVMLGAKNLFQSHRIKCCVFEFGGTTFDMGNTPDQIEDFLKEHRYIIRNIVKKDPLFPGRKSAKTAQFSLHIATPRK